MDIWLRLKPAPGSVVSLNLTTFFYWSSQICRDPPPTMLWSNPFIPWKETREKKKSLSAWWRGHNHAADKCFHSSCLSVRLLPPLDQRADCGRVACPRDHKHLTRTRGFPARRTQTGSPGPLTSCCAPSLGIHRHLIQQPEECQIFVLSKWHCDFFLFSSTPVRAGCRWRARLAPCKLLRLRRAAANRRFSGFLRTFCF